MSNGPVLLSCKEAAAFLRVTERQLARWRSDRRGPPYFNPPGTRPCYLQSDLVLWLERHRVKPTETYRYVPRTPGILPPEPDSPAEETPE